MKRVGKSPIDQRGFTMIEMILVLIVMAIMASFFVTRATTGDDLIAQTEILKSHLRYAQIKAMNDTDVNVPGGWGIHLNNSSYELYRNNTIANNTLYGDILPGESAQTHILPSGVTVFSTTCVFSTCKFDEWGSPGAMPLAITLKQGTSTRTIGITKNTGFVN